VFPPLYAILDPEQVQVSLPEMASRLAASGVALVQLRDKKSSAARVLARARELKAVLAPLGVRFLLNDRPDIAAIADCAGVHVGQDDLLPEDARRIVGPSRWVGVSTHTLDQLRVAAATSADYIAIGPVFPTSTKENPDPVVGLDFIRAARRLTGKPLVAIGGITLETAGEVFRAGADSVAVIRDIVAAQDPAERARAYLAVAEKSRLSRS